MSESADLEPKAASDWRATASVHMQSAPKDDPAASLWWWFVTVLKGIAALAVLVLIVLVYVVFSESRGGRDSPRAEGTQLLGVARDFCRVTYSKNGAWDAVAAAAFDAEVRSGALEGETYSVKSPVVSVTPVGCVIKAHCKEGNHGDGSCGFRWASGESNIVFGAVATIP